MKKSPFKFTDPVLEECEFYTNKGYINEIRAKSEKRNPIKMEINVKTEGGEITEERCILSLQVEVGSKVDTCPFYARVKMKAFFQTTENISEELKGSFMKINAPALLYSYIRPIISSLTGNSMFPRYNLPFMNFTNNHEQDDKDDKDDKNDKNDKNDN